MGPLKWLWGYIKKYTVEGYEMFEDLLLQTPKEHIKQREKLT